MLKTDLSHVWQARFLFANSYHNLYNEYINFLLYTT